MSPSEPRSPSAAKNLKIACWLFITAAVAFGGAAALGAGVMAIVSAALCAIAAILYFRKLKQLRVGDERSDSQS